MLALVSFSQTQILAKLHLVLFCFLFCSSSVVSKGWVNRVRRKMIHVCSSAVRLLLISLYGYCAHMKCYRWYQALAEVVVECFSQQLCYWRRARSITITTFLHATWKVVVCAKKQGSPKSRCVIRTLGGRHNNQSMSIHSFMLCGWPSFVSPKKNPVMLRINLFFFPTKRSMNDYIYSQK